MQTLSGLLLGTLISKEVERVIYIDSDFIIKDDLLQILEIDIQDDSVAADC
ncbi:glycosyltransferase [Lysinibacillus sp. NPDC047702]|uniref:glycosyltransferase n=1 Tax=unclassified Lysinibacillus TaxID=2636778 RepID=UPI003CFFCFE7